MKTRQQLFAEYRALFRNPDAIRHATQSRTYNCYSDVMTMLRDLEGEALLQALQSEIDLQRNSDDPLSTARMDIYVNVLYSLTGRYSEHSPEEEREDV